MPTIFQWIVTQFSLPGLIGIGLGYLIFGLKVKNEKTILGMEAWHPVAACIAGGIVFGFAIWFLIGVFAGPAAS